MGRAILGAASRNRPKLGGEIELVAVGVEHLVAPLSGEQEQLDGGSERLGLGVEDALQRADFLLAQDAVAGLWRRRASGIPARIALKVVKAWQRPTIEC